MERIVFLTGVPGVGKTTVLMKIVEELEEKGFSIGGVVSQEVREGGLRVGFRIVDLDTKREGWLAHLNRKKGPRIGRYGVCLDDLEDVGVQAIQDAIQRSDIVVIDEVGPMELLSQAFRKAVVQALNGDKPVLGIIHHRASDPLIAEIRSREDAAIIQVTRDNRERLPALITAEILERLFRGQ